MDAPEFKRLPDFIGAHFPGLTLQEGVRQMVVSGLEEAARDPARVEARRAAYLATSREARLFLAEKLRELVHRLSTTLPGASGEVYLPPTGTEG
jgi:hypothetical protein